MTDEETEYINNLKKEIEEARSASGESNTFFIDDTELYDMLNRILELKEEVNILNIKINEIIDLFQRYSFTCINGNVTVPQYLILEILRRK